MRAVDVDVAGFPYAEWRFNADGSPRGELILPESGRLTNFLVMSHGWNNAPWRAKELYVNFFLAVRTAAETAGNPLDGFAVIGVHWPSMRWPDEAPAKAVGGGAALSQRLDEDRRLLTDLKATFPDQAGVLDEMVGLLADAPDDPAALSHFHDLLAQLDVDVDAEDALEDHGEHDGLLAAPANVVFARLETTVPRQTGAAAGGATSSLPWRGAREALRAMTYYQMKKRAGVVGRRGLGAALAAAASSGETSLRFHLIGHSFGARLVSYALAGLPADWPGVRSVLLVQGAFSHHAFAPSLPHDPDRSGALAGLQQRVRGPLYVTHSRRDRAVGVLYPRASWLKRDDAAGLTSIDRWGAMGHDGAQGVEAEERILRGVGTKYPAESGSFVNLNANDVIKTGKPPSGAHSDICHPEVGWALLRAAGIS